MQALNASKKGLIEDKNEACKLTNFLPLPTTDMHGRRYSIGHTDLKLTDFGAEQLVVEAEEFPVRGQQAVRWLDRLPNTEIALEGSLTSSSLSFDSCSESQAPRSISFNAVNVAIAKRGPSAFREVSGGPWELRRPSEVQKEAQRRLSSQSIWGSNEDQIVRFRRGFDNIDWAVVDELRAFRWRAPCPRRRLTRPGSPPMSPKALESMRWPEFPDFSVSPEQEDLVQIRTTADPSLEQPHEVEPVSEQGNHTSCDPSKLRKWFPWFGLQ